MFDLSDAPKFEFQSLDGPSSDTWTLSTHEVPPCPSGCQRMATSASQTAISASAEASAQVILTVEDLRPRHRALPNLVHGPGDVCGRKRRQADDQVPARHSLEAGHCMRGRGWRQDPKYRGRSRDERARGQGDQRGEQVGGRRGGEAGGGPPGDAHQGRRAIHRSLSQGSRPAHTAAVATIAQGEKYELFFKVRKQFTIAQQLEPKSSASTSSAALVATSRRLQGEVPGGAHQAREGEGEAMRGGRGHPRCYKIKFLQVVDDAEWDALRIMTPFGAQARIYSPTIMAIRTTRGEKSMAAFLHTKISTKFRIFYDSRSRTFSVRSPRPAATLTPQSQPASPSSSRPHPPLRFWSGVLNEVEPLERPFSVWAQPTSTETRPRPPTRRQRNGPYVPPTAKAKASPRPAAMSEGILATIPISSASPS